MGIPTMADLLKRLVDERGSDLHLAAGSPPRLRIDGELQPCDGAPVLMPPDTKQLAYSVLADTQKQRFEENLELDFSFGVKNLGRFRANLFMQRGSVGMVLRLIPWQTQSFEELGLPPVLSTLCDRPRGLILVTGPTGSGKSTTLATMIDLINRNRRGHIVTVEDPIEFMHSHQSCLVNQRELGADTRSFTAALRSVLREDPDVVLIGEMRDLETVEAALRIAETGHLTLATLHTNSAASTINRIIDVFPAHQQSQIRTQLAMVLEAVLCQSLLPRAAGSGRVMAMEILIPNNAIRNLIREAKIHQIYSSMQAGQEKNGMQTFNQSLFWLYQQGAITFEVARQCSHNTDEFDGLVRRASPSHRIPAH